MDSIRSKLKTWKRSMMPSNPVAAYSDRLSSLPNEILYHILSFLPTCTSVKTSILSRRWRFMWAYVPDLFFGRYDDPDIIYRVMMLHKAKSINTLCITEWADCSELQIDTWITLAVARNVQNLDFRVVHDGFYPRCLFTCKTLVDLRLNSRGVIPKGGIVFLPRLKTLHLIDVQYEDDVSLTNLLAGCPVLEELALGLNERLLSCYNISSPTIERLEVCFYFRDSRSHECRLLINTPALGYLVISDRFGDYVTSNSLIEAYIYLDKNSKKQHDFLYSRSVPKFIDWLGFLNAEGLDLVLSSSSTEFAYSKFFAGMISFPTLTTLQLASDCCLLTKFLENADNLETLVFSEISVEEKTWTEPRRVPKCLLSNLRVVAKLVNVVDKSNNFEMVRYLLKNARVLEKMEIVYPKSLDSEAKMNMFKEIARFRRASNVCEVAFVEAVR